MLSDSTEQIIIKLSLSLPLSLCFSLPLPSYGAALQSPSHLMLRGRTPVRALSSCTVSVNIRNMLPLTPSPLWAECSTSAQSHWQIHTAFSPLDLFIHGPRSWVFISGIRAVYRILLWALFIYINVYFMGCCWGTFIGIRQEFPLLCSSWNVWLGGISNNEQAVSIQRLTQWLFGILMRCLFYFMRGMLAAVPSWSTRSGNEVP